MTPVGIKPAANPDLGQIRALLAAADLPTEGLEEHLPSALVAHDAGKTIGCVALERHGAVALLRSLVVSASHRGHGVGRQLTRAALDLAREDGVATVYLLTTTAVDFFARHFAFRCVDRADVAVPVRQSVEFVSACPATAKAMVRELDW